MTATCVRRPKMGSYSDSADLPFGYYVSDEALKRPPPPRGDPILDPNDSSLLGNFFHGMETNEYNLSYGEGLNFSDQWIGQVAPNLVGHSTSYGPQPPLDPLTAAVTGEPPVNLPDMFTFGQAAMHQSHHSMARPLPPHQHQPQHSQQQLQQLRPASHSPHQHTFPPLPDRRDYSIPSDQDAHADIAAVLTTLHHSGQQNMHTGRTNSLNAYHQPPNPQAPRTQATFVPRSQRMQIHPDDIRMSRSNEADTLFTDMIFGTHEPTTQRQAEPQPLQWGSDGLFARGQGYMPPAHESSEALEKKRMATVKEALRINNSSANTRASSPTAAESTAHTFHEHTNGNIREEGDALAAAKRRRVSKARIDVEEDGDCTAPIPTRTAARKRKSKGDLNGIPELSSEIPESAGKRRKSAPSQPKPPRENLTDAQKRENHIRSEQKRRGAIKEGFEDLTFIVPNLQNGGYSKSTMLLLAGEWLETLINGNEKLKS